MRANKTSTIQARIDPKLRKKGDAILEALGLTASQAVNAMYAQIVLRNGLPFELKIPTDATKHAMDELEAGGGKTFSSFKEMIDDSKK